MVICQPPLEMGEETEFENGPKWSNFRLSWAPDLDLGSGHGHLSSSTTCLSNFIEIEETFVDGRTDTQTEICHPKSRRKCENANVFDLMIDRHDIRL